jgi:hypothetical protein
MLVVMKGSFQQPLWTCWEAGHRFTGLGACPDDSGLRNIVVYVLDIPMNSLPVKLPESGSKIF